MSKNTITDDQLLADITNAAITYGEGLENGNSRHADKGNLDATKAFRTLKERGSQARILELLGFAHPAVRLMAAVFAMEFDKGHALPVLESLSNGPKGPICASAYGVLYLHQREQKTAAA